MADFGKSLLVKQRESLVDVIDGAKKAEEFRMRKLARVKLKGEREALCRRFEKERELDHAKVENLTNDYLILQEKVRTGQLHNLATARTKAPKQEKCTDRVLKNRFVGLECHEDIIFHADIVNKFDRHDQKFEERQTRPVYNAHAEHKKLKLLGERRDILKQLINIHAAEISAGASDYTGRSGVSSHASYTSSRSSPRSDISSLSGPTTFGGASYASFASSGRNTKVKQNTVPNIVPKLNLHKK